jgi:hypothetical protein
MAWEVWRGTRKFHDPLPSLEAARAVVEADVKHSAVLASPFGGTAAINWTWNLEALEARSDEDGEVAYTIRRKPGT